MVWGGRREEGSGWGTHAYLWRIHVNVWQNQYNIVKFKNKKGEKKQTWVNSIEEIDLEVLIPLIKSVISYSISVVLQKNVNALTVLQFGYKDRGED